MLSLVMVGLNCVWTYAVKIDQQYVSIIVLFPPKEDEVIKDNYFPPVIWFLWKLNILHYGCVRLLFQTA